jgi:AcrB/AcrD/AcrF family
MMDPAPRQPLLSRVVDLFLRGSLPPLLVAASLAAGAFALIATAREEEPQIVVPMADVRVSAPGLPPEEVERQIATRLEKLLTQVDGVEHVYSVSLPGEALVTVRFYVGEDREDSLVKIYNKIYSSTDQIPPAVRSWVVKPVEIDDVPILIATLWSERPERVDDYALRRIAEELEIAPCAWSSTRTPWPGARPRPSTWPGPWVSRTSAFRREASTRPTSSRWWTRATSSRACRRSGAPS